MTLLKINSFLVLVLLVQTTCSRSKIVGLVPVRNESKMIVPCLKALSLYTDAIIVLDDASDDATVAGIKSVQAECNIEKIIEKKVWYRDEPGDRNLLLKAGREIDGTHFVVIDADEMLTANLLKNNIFRKKVLALNPGDKMCVTWINLWRSCDFYRYDSSVWCEAAADIVFCDDGKCFYESDFIHTSRSPGNLVGKKTKLVTDNKNFIFLDKIFKELNSMPILDSDSRQYDLNNIQLQRYFIDNVLNIGLSVEQSVKKVKSVFLGKDSLHCCYRNDFTAGLMHFQFVNWDNLLAKQAWYRCLEKIRNPSMDASEINIKYGRSKNEEDIRRLKCPEEWFAGYDFFDSDVYELNESWQKQQVKKWFTKYGRNYFEKLDIWDIDWD